MNELFLLAADDASGWMVLLFVAVVVGVLLFLAVFAQFFGLWIQCKMTRAAISFPNLVMMRIRKVSPTVIVRSKIMASQEIKQLSRDQSKARKIKYNFKRKS